VIRSFGDQRTADVFHGHATREVKRLDAALVKRTVRKLDMIVAANQMVDLRAPPGNRLEALHADLDGWFSIRVNDQWRLIFRWIDAAAVDVKLVDYH
jgi:proteic killer suppression protein